MSLRRKLEQMSLNSLDERTSSLARKVQSLEDRGHNQRDKIVKLEQKLGYLACEYRTGGHNYMFEGKGRVGDEIVDGVLYKRGVVGYKFYCCKCLHQVVRTEKELSESDRKALRRLGLLEKA